MSFAIFDTVPPRTSLPSRVALALAHANVASNTQPQADPTGLIEDPHDRVNELLDQCGKPWTDLKNAPYPNTELAKGTAALNGFRHYMIQDAIYLEYFARVRMESISRTGTWKDIKDFVTEASEGLKYAITARSECTTKLGVSEVEVAKEEPSTALMDSVSLYEAVASTGNWLDLNIIQLPCILGYYAIAAKLKNDVTTVKESPYYKLWIDVNADDTYDKQYRDFVNSHINTLTEAQRNERWQGWITKLKLACEHEMAFFRLGSTTPSYQIVKDRVYKIHSKLSGYLVLSASSDSVTTQMHDLTDSGEWTLTNLKDGTGYTIHVTVDGKQHFLVASIGDPQVAPTLSIVSDPSTKKTWSINIHNPVTVSPGLPDLYQFLVPGGVQWVLDAAAEGTTVVAKKQDDKRHYQQSWQLVSA